MVSEEPTKAPPGTEDPKSSKLAGLVQRMKSALKRGSPSKDPANASPPEPIEAPVPQEHPEPMPHAPTTAQVAQHPDPLPHAPLHKPTPAAADKKEPIKQYETTRQALLEERARTIFSKYNLSFEPEWMPHALTTNPSAIVERVHKPIRIRVHRYCHRCETVFGPDRSCVNCDHKRCWKCPRYPTEKRGRDGPEMAVTKEKPTKGKDRERSAKPGTREPLLVIQSRGTGKILVHQPIMQRVRRTCHKCNSLFVPASAQSCTTCGHVRCTKCPRSPAKPTKWESGYPGDATPSSDEAEQENVPRKQERVFRKPRQRVRWYCDHCSTLFLEGSMKCRSCGHDKCDGCVRHPPKKAKDSFDPEIVNTLHEKLSALVVTAPAH